jgi:hypothetical protein
LSEIIVSDQTIDETEPEKVYPQDSAENSEIQDEQAIKDYAQQYYADKEQGHYQEKVNDKANF